MKTAFSVMALFTAWSDLKEKLRWEVIGLVLVALMTGGCNQSQATPAAGVAQGANNAAQPASPPTSEQKAKDSAADNAVVIPLKQIWAWGMPGTRSIEELEISIAPKNVKRVPSDEQVQPNQSGFCRSTAISLTESSRSWPREDQAAGPGFVVPNTGLDALRAAHGVLTEGEKPRKSLPFGNEATIVFFSYQSSHYVHLQMVERRENVITVQYRAVPHLEKHVTAHFAHIPLGTLPIGTYRVEIAAIPLDLQSIESRFGPADKNWTHRFVCKSFSFSVNTQGGED
jgi:hypothetical protein